MQAYGHRGHGDWVPAQSCDAPVNADQAAQPGAARKGPHRPWPPRLTAKAAPKGRGLALCGTAQPPGPAAPELAMHNDKMRTTYRNHSELTVRSFSIYTCI